METSGGSKDTVGWQRANVMNRCYSNPELNHTQIAVATKLQHTSGGEAESACSCWGTFNWQWASHCTLL
jgi:hypothetical protein